MVPAHTRMQKMAHHNVRVVLPFGFTLCLETHWQKKGPHEDRELVHDVASLPTLAN
jgi:hypothetical protein